MSLAIYENTEYDIQKAYEAESIPKIAKETQYVFDRMIHFMLSTFKNRLKGITFETNDFTVDEAYLLSDKNKKHLSKMIQFLKQVTFPISDTDFGKIKFDLERWYSNMGGEKMYFEYQEGYLITPKEAADLLSVTTVTINKYIKQGLETIDTTSHRKIPKHAIELWRDPVYAIRIQMLSQQKKMQNQTAEERLKEVRDEIIELQKKYKAKTSEKALADRGIINLDAFDDPAPFREWMDLEEEHEELLEELIGGSRFA